MAFAHALLYSLNSRTAYHYHTRWSPMGHPQNCAFNLRSFEISRKVRELKITGPNFTTPPPLTPENALLGVGAYKRRGHTKLLPRGGTKCTTPPPLTEKCPLGQNLSQGGGGGVCNIALERCGPFCSPTNIQRILVFPYHFL